MTSEARSRVSPRTHDALAIGALVVALGFALFSPEDVVQGDLTRMLYIHVPSIITAYAAFGLTTVATIGYLAKRDLRWDRWAAASAEVGVVFLGLAIATGMIWGKPVWGVWWTWDARLTSTALMFFIYLGYLGLRRSIPDPESRARRSAILGIVAVVQIPIVHYSVLWWNTLHQAPTILRPGEPQIDPPLAAALFVSMAAFLVVFSALLRRRLILGDLEALAYEAGAGADAPLAGDAVTAPRLGATKTEEAVS
jgi:heme exporter protein C